MNPNKKRAGGKNVAVITLCIALAVTILFGVIGFTGLSFLGIPRWLPSADSDNWPEALPLGLDLQGGVYVEYTAVPTTPGVSFDQAADGAIDMIRDRLTNAGQTEANIQKLDGGIRIEIPIKRDQNAAPQPAEEAAAPAEVNLSESEENKSETTAEETTSEETAPETAAEETTSEETAPETAADETASKETAPETAADETASGETAPETAAEETTSGETAPETAADETATEETAPETAAEEAEADDGHTHDTAEAAQPEGEYIQEVLSKSRQSDKTINIADNDAIKKVLDLIGEPAVLRFVDPTGYVFMKGSEAVKSASYFYNNQAEVGASPHQISLELTDKGKELFGEYTTKWVNNYIAIYLDDVQLLSAVVKEPILTGTCTISGSYDEKSASDVAKKINAGALPLELTQDKVDMVSATLGQDALSSSVTAALIGILLIMLLMIFRYRLNGVIASWALSIYVILLFALIALFKVHLTLAGLAGIVLGIGMAVDANVIIFERFNEEARKGRSAKAAVRAGFKNAISAILDANVTTLIAAIVLMILGTGSIQGFAYTLLLGVVVSMITAVLVTRFLMNRFVDAGCSEIRLFAKVKAEEEVAE